MGDQAPARSVRERREAAADRLRAGGNLWLATADGRGPHLIPVSSWWDGDCLTTSTTEDSRTLANTRTQPQVRAAVGGPTDVLLIDAEAAVMPTDDVDEAAKARYERASRIPRGAPGLVYVQLQPRRMQMWKGVAEFSNPAVIHDRAWLDD